MSFVDLLVTGGTGTLGRATVPLLAAAGHAVRVLSRRTGPGLTTGDLERGEGLARALDGIHTVVHLATSGGARDVRAAANLAKAAAEAGIEHLVAVSIVGVDNVPLPGAMCAWAQAFVDEHYRPEPKQRRRPASFKAPGAR